MPKTDMPLAELRCYCGSSPRPADYDRYWQKALEQALCLPLDYTLEPGDFSTDQVVCSHLYFNSIGGARIHAQLMLPQARTAACPVLLLFHGYEGHTHDWYEKLPFALSGIAVLAMDVRGQAGLSQDNGIWEGSTFQGHIVRGIRANNPEQLFYRNVYLDTVVLARIVRSFAWADASHITAAGFSQGGALALACSALCAQGGLPMEYTVSGYPFLCDFVRMYESGFTNRAVDELSLYFRLQDPLHKTEQRFFELLGYLDVEWMAEKICNPVRMFSGLCDAVVPPSTHFAAYNHLACAQKEMLVYPDHGHEDLPGAWMGILKLLLGQEHIAASAF